MSPEEIARKSIDKRLEESGWVVQDLKHYNPLASLGVAVREYPTSTGEVDYALFIDQQPVGVIEAKRDIEGENMTVVESQSARYANSTMKYIKREYRIRFAYEATGKLTIFTDYDDINYCSRPVFSFHRPETLQNILRKSDTLRNRLKQFPSLDSTGFRECQTIAIQNLDKSFANNHSRALVQMATGAGKTFTAITEAYRLLKYGKMGRILFLCDTRSLCKQAEDEFRKYVPNDDPRTFPEIYGVHRLRSSKMPKDVSVYICTIQRMYSILRGEYLDEADEDESFYEQQNADRRKPKLVAYNSSYPPEFFDCIIVDECHRSIYNVWNQVLEYFDAFIIGLTATPDNRTFAYFRKNVVSEYTREQAIIDGVNVKEDIFVIDTALSKKGAKIERQVIGYRNRMTREKRWELMDEDYEYGPTQLDRSVVNPDQIRTVIQAFRDSVFSMLFPRREEVPKTLIFAKTDSHAEDIVNTVREVFGMGNEFCKKITCKAENAEERISEFRNDYYPRIAVTVSMIATGTDVKSIECLLFMRDVRSSGLFEQMKGRGTRVLSLEDLKKVSPSAAEVKDHFVIIDAVGVTRSVKTQTRELEYKPSVKLHDILMDVAFGERGAETLTTLANRIIRLDRRMTDREREQFAEKIGNTPSAVARSLLDAFDEDIISAALSSSAADDGTAESGGTASAEPAAEEKPSSSDASAATEGISSPNAETVQNILIDRAVKPFLDPSNRDFIENIHRAHEQIIDDVNLDTLLFAGFDTSREESADRIIKSFHEFIEENMDEITALGIIYDQKYSDRPMAIEALKNLYGVLMKRGINCGQLWECYETKYPDKIKRGTVGQLTDLVTMIRFEMGKTDSLEHFSDRVSYNFQQWTLRRNAGAVHFTDEQMKWLRLIRDHIAASLSVKASDLDLSPFDREGGLGRFYEVFGENYEDILREMNIELVA